MEWLKSLDWTQVVTTIGTGLTVIGLVYTFIRNFKADIGGKFDKMEKRIDTLEERMFWLATGKTLTDAILEEKMKLERQKNEG
jgi:hypothetical protein